MSVSNSASRSDLITKSSKSLYHDRRLGIPRALKGEAAGGDFSSLRNCASLGPVKDPTFRSRLVSERKPMELSTKRQNLWYLPSLLICHFADG